MKSQLIKKLFKAYADRDGDTFLRTAQEVIRDEERKNHNILARDLRNIVRNISSNGLNGNQFSKRYKTNIPIPRDREKGFPLCEIRENYYGFHDLIVEKELMRKLKRLIAENESAEIIRSHGLCPKKKILLCGPPGTGKTLTSQVLSSEFGFPLVYVRFDSIVSSYLGETASNLRKIFDFIEHGQWIVLFDEFDIIGKRRDDPEEHGEIKRVVNNFMQMLDNFSGESILIAATNHQHLLDVAIWRRFDEIVYYTMPDKQRREKLFNKYLKVLRVEDDVDVHKLVALTDAFSPSDIAQVCADALKLALIAGEKSVGLDEITRSINDQRERKDVLKRG